MTSEDEYVTSRRNILRGSAVAGGLALGTAMAVSREGLTPAAAAAASPAEAAGAVDYWVQLDGIPGSSIAKSHVGWVDVRSYHFGASDAAVVGSPTGSGGGKVTLKPLTITKFIDKASPNLFVACTTGKHLKTATLALRRGSQAGDFLRISLSDVIVTDYDQSAGGHAAPTESVTLAYAKIKTAYA